MNRWATRFRRAAIALVGVHLLQVILLAASAVCDVSIAAPTDHAAHTVAAMPASHSEAHSEHHSGHHAPMSDSSPDTPHHTSHPTSCPMAMACAATAIIVPVPMLASREVQVSTERIIHDGLALSSMHQTPEPPPPRG
ncbi:hypothetical protein [Gemmatimonas sp.]|jgi:hypothetical protein|uniref:hypothetical protein n=1 Tax=Gemmatimonas sp. TaxID=1962908 RepID=UPI0037BF6419